MKRERVFWLLMIVGTLAAVAIGTELFVRAVVDDGMQFDLEMWKYARDLKQVSRNLLIGHEHRPNTRARLMGVDVAINSRGLRDREIDYEPAPGTLRVLMLGDSFTEGWGVAFDETFSKRIERLYAERGVRAEIINAGVGNYNTVMEVSYFLEEGWKYRPDIVVLNFIFNDAEPIPSHETPPELLGLCEACTYLYGRIDTLLRDASLLPDWKTYYLSLYGSAEPGWIDARNAIARLAAYAHAHGIKLLIADLPELHVLAPYPLLPISTLVQQAARENGADFVETLPALRAEQPETLWVSSSDAHPNGRAHALIADALFHKLLAMQ